LSQPEHIGAIIARAFLDLEQRIKDGTAKAHPLCRCEAETRLVEPAPQFYVTVFLHDDDCPAISRNGKAA